MSTHARLFVPNKDGSFSSIYIHWDGYPQHVGKILNEHYTDPATVDQLIDLGDISELKSTIESTIAYHRDRGELLNIDVFEELEPKVDVEYLYLFKDGEWLVSKNSILLDWHPVDKAIAK